MKNINLSKNTSYIWILLLVILTSGCECQKTQEKELRLASFNLLSNQFKFHKNLASDSISVVEKRNLQTIYIDSLQPDLLLVQEAEPLYGQVDYLSSKLSGFKSVKGSNGLAILYSSEELEIKEKGYVDSLGLQNATFRVKKNDRLLNVINVHLAGGEGSYLGLRKAVIWASAKWNLNKESVILAGDMNIPLLGEYYSLFIEEFPIFSDPMFPEANKNKDNAIDWVLLNPGLKALNSGSIRKKVKGYYVSDHPLVWADVVFCDHNLDYDFSKSEIEAKQGAVKSQKNPIKLDMSFRKHFYLNGNNYFLAADNQEIINAKKYSISFWIKGSEQNNQLGQNYLLSNQGYPFGWEIEIRSGVLYFEGRLATKTDAISKGLSIVGKTKVIPENWYHLVLTVDKDKEAKLYLNGVLEGSVKLEQNFLYHVENPGIFLGTRWDLRNIFKGVITKPEIFGEIVGAKELELFYKKRRIIWDKPLLVDLKFEEVQYNFNN